MPTPKERENIGLPPRVFLYTLDQISNLLSIPLDTLKAKYIHYYGRSVGVAPKDLMRARNIAPEGEKPEWRVIESEFIRWMRRHGYRVYDHTQLG